MKAIKIGTMIYHESRYWKTEGLAADEVPGWNARYLPYVVAKVTPARIYCTGCGPTGRISRLQFPRAPKHKPGYAKPTTLETDGKQYHSRFHEYFYVEIPEPKVRHIQSLHLAEAIALLNLPVPYSHAEAKRAFKRLAPKYHPDTGGSNEGFVRLKAAYHTALRGY